VRGVAGWGGGAGENWFVLLGHQRIVIASPSFTMKPIISNGYLSNKKVINK